MRHRFFCIALPLICISSLVGCGSDGGEPPEKTYPVSGTITLNGKPIVGADVTFINDESDRSAFGRTNDQGEYQLTTFSSNDGAVEGKHAVTIVKFEAPPKQSKVADINSEAYVPPGFNESTDPVKPESSIPDKYASQETSGLIAVVNKEGENKIDFKLEN